jgi:hypothetical protein
VDLPKQARETSNRLDGAIPKRCFSNDTEAPPNNAAASSFMSSKDKMDIVIPRTNLHLSMRAHQDFFRPGAGESTSGFRYFINCNPCDGPTAMSGHPTKLLTRW